jgi:hypothetical protein
MAQLEKVKETQLRKRAMIQEFDAHREKWENFTNKRF